MHAATKQISIIIS